MAAGDVEITGGRVECSFRWIKRLRRSSRRAWGPKPFSFSLVRGTVERVGDSLEDELVDLAEEPERGAGDDGILNI